MASATQAPPAAAPPATPAAVTPTGTNNSGAEKEQKSTTAAGIGRRGIRLATMLPRAIGGVALRLLGRGGKKKTERRFGGLKDVVSYSSRRMAAGRALEHELGSEGGALFLDPLAAALAGPAAIEDARKWASACSTAATAISDALAAGERAPSKQELVDLISSQDDDKKGGSNFTIGAPLSLVALAGRSIHRGRVDGSYSSRVTLRPAEHSVSLVTARHRWFDAGILEALAGEGRGVEVKLVEAKEKGKVRAEISPRGGGEGIQQVVLLGSGMDARAWRLDLPKNNKNSVGGSGVAWFDLDSAPVCEIKRRELEGAGAELVKEREGGEKVSTPPPRFPLKVASYALVGCDMALGEEWVTKLKESGFDPSRPALFAAEGLIYYLGSKAPEFMRFLQSVAAPGSILLLDALDEPGVASAVKKAEGKGLQAHFSFGVAAELGELARFFSGFGFDRLVAADTWTVLRERFQREAPQRCFTKDKPSCGRPEGGIRFIAVSKS